MTSFSPRDALVRRIQQAVRAHASGPLVVSLEDFFTDNDDPYSIACNLGEMRPSNQEFLSTLQRIRSREDVQDVLVEIHEIEDPEFPDAWPYAERVYVLTRASAASVAQWTEALHPDTTNEGYMFGEPQNAPDLSEGMHVVELWWD